MVQVAWSTSNLKVYTARDGSATVCESCCKTTEPQIDDTTVPDICSKCFGNGLTPLYYTVEISDIISCGGENNTCDGSQLNAGPNGFGLPYKLELVSCSDTGEDWDNSKWIWESGSPPYQEGDRRVTLEGGEGGGGGDIIVIGRCYGAIEENWDIAVAVQAKGVLGGVQCDHIISDGWVSDPVDSEEACTSSRSGYSGRIKWCPYWYPLGCP